MVTATAAAWIGGITAAGGLALQVKGQQDQKEAAKKTAKAQRAFNAKQEQIAEVKSARARRSAFRQARRERGRLIAQSGGDGTLQSSSSITAAGGVGTQLGSNIGFQQTLETFGGQANIFAQSIADQQVASSEAKALTDLGGTIFSNAQNVSSFAKSPGGFFGMET
jgi:hypothetical protein